MKTKSNKKQATPNPLFHCSRLKDICTYSRKQGEISETAKSVILEQLLLDLYGYKKGFATIDTLNGQLTEDACIAKIKQLEVNAVKLSKNERLYKSSKLHLCGTPDALRDDAIIEVKTTRNPVTFFKDATSEIPKEWVYQIHGYMLLTGLKKALLAYFLIETHEILKKSAWVSGYKNMAGNEKEQSIFARAEAEYGMDDVKKIPASDREKYHEIAFDQTIADDIIRGLNTANSVYQNLYNNFTHKK